MPLANIIHHIAYMIAIAGALLSPARAQALAPTKIVGDGIPESLNGARGDATRGRALVLDRTSTCILCHSGPFPETRFQGDLAPSLAGAGNRWIVTEWERCARTWGNALCPCLHSDPGLPDCAPGQTVRVAGRLLFREG